MKRIAVRDLAAGQRFSRPVYVDGDSLFVPEGIPIKQRDIARLEKWGVEEVSSEGEPIPDDPRAAFNAFFLSAFNSASQQRVIAAYTRLRDELMALFGKLRAGEELTQDPFNQLVDHLLKLVDSGADDVIQYVLYGMQGETGDVENGLNCATLAAIVAKKLQMPRHRLLTLVTAALLRDVGMFRIRPEIIAKEGSLSPEERRQVQTHPVHSYRMVSKELGYGDDVAIAVLQHHERWDGQGYPRKSARDKIRLEARVIAVTDSFVAMVSRKPYRSSMIGYTAMRNLLSDNGTRFDPDILKVFIQVIGIYPLGSIVLLNDSSVCRVIGNRAATPLKPKVKVIIDAAGHEYVDDSGDVIDLAEASGRFIAKAVDANSLSERHNASL